MKIEILGEKNNLLLHRREITAAVKDYKSTPATTEVVAAIAQKLSAPQDLIVLKNFKQAYGQCQARCDVKIYEDEKNKQKYEPKPAKKQKKGAKAKPEEKPGEEAKPEKIEKPQAPEAKKEAK